MLCVLEQNGEKKELKTLRETKDVAVSLFFPFPKYKLFIYNYQTKSAAEIKLFKYHFICQIPKIGFMSNLL